MDRWGCLCGSTVTGTGQERNFTDVGTFLPGAQPPEGPVNECTVLNPAIMQYDKPLPEHNPIRVAMKPEDHAAVPDGGRVSRSV